MRRDDSVQVEARRQQPLDDGVLVVRLVLGIGVEDEAGTTFSGAVSWGDFLVIV